MSKVEIAPGRFYLPCIDGLRFFAAVAVLVHHGPRTQGWGWLKDFGWIGVDLFLCLSAFLITKLIVLEHSRTGTFRFKNFFIRRALRIWPLYFMFATAASAAALLGSMSPQTIFAWWLSHLSFSNNIMVAAYGYSPVPFTQPLWTISLEEQAYVILPLVLLAWLAAGKNVAIALKVILLALLCLVAARAALVLSGIQPPFVFVLPLRSDAFLIGVACALVYDQFVPRLHTLMLSIAVLVALALFMPTHEPIFQIVGFLIGSVSIGLVLLIVLKTPVLSNTLSLGPLPYLGKISYGVYVYHLVGHYIAQRFVHSGLPFIQLLSGLIITVLIAAISYRTWEKPFLRLKPKFSAVESRPI